MSLPWCGTTSRSLRMAAAGSFANRASTCRPMSPGSSVVAPRASMRSTQLLSLRR